MSINSFPGQGDARLFSRFRELRQPRKVPSRAPIDNTEAVPATFSLVSVPSVEARCLPEARLVFHHDPNSPGADRFRQLRMRLREAQNATKLKKVLITSALPHDGKSTISLNLASALTERGERSVLLIEADLYRPCLVRQLQLQPWPGLAESLEDQKSAVPAVRRVEPLGWYLLPGGVPSGNPTELLQSDALAGVLQDLAPRFDWILIDAPPLVPFADALSVARQADATLFVVRSGVTPRSAIDEAVALLGPKNIFGVVFNGAADLNHRYSKYQGYYAQESSAFHDEEHALNREP